MRGTYGYYRASLSGTKGTVHSNNVGLFVQDAWAITNRLTLNLGLRTEHERIPSYTTARGENPTALDFGFKDKLAPRLGFAWDVKGDGRWKVYGSWGIFYDIMKLQMARSVLGGDQGAYFYYSLDNYDWTKLGGPGCPPACSGNLLDLLDLRMNANDPTHNRIDPNLKPMQSRELTFGFDHEISPTMSAGVRFVHKYLVYAIEDVGYNLPDGELEYWIANPGFGVGQYQLGTQFPAQPKATRDYRAFEANLQKRMAARWSFNMSYVLSRLWGNYAGLANSDENGRAAPNTNGAFDFLYQSFDQNAQPVFGRLPTDRAHQFKAQLVYNMPFGTTVGVSEFVASGTPISRRVEIPMGWAMNYYMGRMSDGRTPTISQTDLYVQHEFKPRGRTRLQLSLNVLNLFDQMTVTDKFDYETMDPISVTTQQFFSGVDVQALIAAQGTRRDPRFLMASAWQAPRTARIGVKFTF